MEHNKRMVQVIFNSHLEQLTKVEIVQSFVEAHRMNWKVCSWEENHSLALYRLPYVIGIWDAQVENYLEVVLLDIESELLIEGNVVLGRSLDLGLLELDHLREQDFKNHPQSNIFLSNFDEKMDNLQTFLQAIGKLLPLIEAKGGLSSMKDGTFDSRFDFSTSVKPSYPGLKQRYLNCIADADHQYKPEADPN